MKKEDSLIQVLEKNKIKIINIVTQIFYWLFAVGVMLYFRNSVFQTTENIKNILFVAMLIMSIAIDAMLILFKKIIFDFHKQFIILATVLGIFYFIATPFGNGTDEVSHFLRVFKISQKYTNIRLEEDSLFPPAFSKLVDYKNSVLIGYENYINEFDAFSMNSAERKDLISEYWNIKLYSPLQYVPQVIGVTIGRVISDNIVVIGMCGRITGYIFWVAMCAWAIKIVPNKKAFFLIICLLPINIFSAICISGDTVTNAVCTLFIAIIYRKIYLKEKINKKEKVLLVALACMTALCKIVYLPFVTLSLLLKEDNFENKKEWKKFIVILIAASIIVGLGWFVVGSTNLANSNSLSKEQLKYILTNPFEYCAIIARTFTQYGAQYIFQLCTGHELMCHAKTTVYPIISYITSIALFMSLFTNEDNKKMEVNILRKIWVALIILGTSLLIVTAIYIQWTSLPGIGKVGNEIIKGIQGRYFIPVVLLLIFIANKTKLNTNQKILITTVILMQLPVICQIMNVFA